jgi:hypothetical protein
MCQQAKTAKPARFRPGGAKNWKLLPVGAGEAGKNVPPLTVAELGSGRN